MVRDQRTSSEAAKARNLTYEFMRDFYPCPSCRTNFLAQYADCSDRVCDVDAGGPEVPKFGLTLSQDGIFCLSV